MRIYELVNENYKQLNDNDLYIWEYISNHMKECSNLSIEELAKRCNVSRTTVLRFSKKLGLKGYSELKVILSMEKKVLPNPETRQDLIFDVYRSYMDYLKSVDFTSVLDKVHKAKNLYVHSTGVVQDSVAEELKRSFLMVNKLFFNISSVSEKDAFLDIITPDDLVFIISYSGESQSMIEFARQLKINNISIVSITANKNNSLSHVADECLYVDAGNVDNPLGARFESLVSYYILIDYLSVSYMQYCEDRGEL